MSFFSLLLIAGRNGREFALAPFNKQQKTLKVKITCDHEGN